MLKTLYSLALLGLVTACQTVTAGGPLGFDGSSAIPTVSRPMTVAGASLPPRGFVEFCARNAAACDETAVAAEPVRLTPERWQELNQINTAVNRSFTFTADSVTYGKSEHWTYLESEGDCEDFALEKQRRLVERGWPADSLLIAVAKVPSQGGHAVLVAVTENGDYVLDVLTTAVRPWHEVNYRWLKRQAPGNPKAWLKLVA